MAGSEAVRTRLPSSLIYSKNPSKTHNSMLENLMRERGVLKTMLVREAIVLLAKATRTRFDDGGGNQA